MNLNLRHSNRILSLMLTSVCISFSACQKPTIPEEVTAEIKHHQSASHVVPDVDAICQNLKKDMLDMSAQRTTFALEEINRDIRLCLPLVSADQQKNLMKLSDQMYSNFLKVERSPMQQRAFDQYAFDQSPFPTIQQSHIEQLHIRDQYLLRHKGQAYIEVSDQATGNTTYYRNSQYLAKVFAPYFPEAEKEFMMELGQQNQTATFKKNSLLIDPQETLRRALFWEDYLKKFPNSPLKKEAQYLLNAYRYFLFIGLPDSPVSIHYDGVMDIQASSLNEIERLAQHQNSPLADQAKRFLKFIHLNPEQRAQLSGSSVHDLDAISQLKHYLDLPAFDLNSNQVRDCFSDAICR